MKKVLILVVLLAFTVGSLDADARIRGTQKYTCEVGPNEPAKPFVKSVTLEINTVKKEVKGNIVLTEHTAVFDEGDEDMGPDEYFEFEGDSFHHFHAEDVFSFAFCAESATLTFSLTKSKEDGGTDSLFGSVTMVHDNGANICPLLCNPA